MDGSNVFPRTNTMACTEFHRMMAERKAFAPGSLEYEYRTRAARKLVWLMRGIPTSHWTA